MPWPWSYNFLFKANFRKWLNVLLPNCTCNFQRRQRKERTQMEISLPVNRDAIRSEKYWVETIYSRLPISHIISWRQKYSECPPSRSAVICLSESADSWGDCPPPGTSYIAYFKLIRHFFIFKLICWWWSKIVVTGWLTSVVPGQTEVNVSLAACFSRSRHTSKTYLLPHS